MKLVTANAHQNQQCIFFEQMKPVKCEQIKNTWICELPL